MQDENPSNGTNGVDTETQSDLQSKDFNARVESDSDLQSKESNSRVAYSRVKTERLSIMDRNERASISYFHGSSSRRSQARSVDSDLFWLPPDSDGPLKVDFRCACFDVSNVNTATLSAEIKFVVILFWNDNRFEDSFMTTNDLPGELWGPDITLDNSLVDCTKLYDSFSLIDSSTGRLKRTITFHGSVWNPMDLKDFPFDRDDLELKFVTNSNWRVLDESRFGNDPVHRTYYLNPMREEKFFFFGGSNTMHEFDITGWDYDIFNPKDKEKENEPIVFEFRFHLVRRYNFYYLKILLPLWLLVLTSAASFMLEPEELPGRFEFLTTVLLAIVGFLYIVQESIPKIGFLTVIDKVVILSLITVVLSIFVSVLIERNQHLKLNIICGFSIQGFYWLANFLLVLPAHRRVIKILKDEEEAQMKSGKKAISSTSTRNSITNRRNSGTSSKRRSSGASEIMPQSRRESKFIDVHDLEFLDTDDY